jgi:hypothetical protein
MTMSEHGFPYTWEQLSFDAEPVCELICRVGLVPGGDHSQIQIECHDATRGQLIALSSWPHLSLGELEGQLPGVLVDFLTLVRRYSGPFEDR